MQLIRWMVAAAGAAALAITNAHAARVAGVSPQGEVAEVRQVVVRYDQAVVPAGDPRLPAPYTLQCNGQTPPGTARWLSDRAWAYVLATPLAAAYLVRSSVGMSCRERTSVTGWCRSFRMTRHASTTSLGSPGRSTIRPGIARRLARCSIGWCVGPSSPTPMESCVKI